MVASRDANKVLDQIEREFRARGGRFEAKPLAAIRPRIPFHPPAEIARTLFVASADQPWSA
jgi:hypothetical protein